METFKQIKFYLLWIPPVKEKQIKTFEEREAILERQMKESKEQVSINLSKKKKKKDFPSIKIVNFFKFNICLT